MSNAFYVSLILYLSHQHPCHLFKGDPLRFFFFTFMDTFVLREFDRQSCGGSGLSINLYPYATSPLPITSLRNSTGVSLGHTRAFFKTVRRGALCTFPIRSDDDEEAGHPMSVEVEAMEARLSDALIKSHSRH